MSAADSSFFAQKLLTALLTFPPATIDFFPTLFHFRLKNGSVSPAVTLRHSAFSSQQHQGFICFLASPFPMQQKKLNSSTRGTAEGQSETHKHCLQYCEKMNFRSLHFCVVSIILTATKKKSWVDAFLCKVKGEWGKKGNVPQSIQSTTGCTASLLPQNDPSLTLSVWCSSVQGSEINLTD